jgi:hypothetical protein
MRKQSKTDDSAGQIGLVKKYARMWPREVFDALLDDSKTRTVSDQLAILDKKGVYVLYRDDIPFYVGRADKLRTRLESHATKPASRYDYFWNFFSVFVIEDDELRNTVEGVLIAAMPTSNSARPSLDRHPTPPEITKLMRNIRRFRANPRLDH